MVGRTVRSVRCPNCGALRRFSICWMRLSGPSELSHAEIDFTPLPLLYRILPLSYTDVPGCTLERSWYSRFSSFRLFSAVARVSHCR